jgi:hypothetical protein
VTIVLDPEQDVQVVDHPSWWAQTTVQKWADDDDYQAGKAPDEIITLEKNLLLLAGITRLSNLIASTGAYIGTSRAVTGTTNTSATVTDTSAALADLGSAVVCAGVPLGAYIIAPITAGVSYTLSAAATATAGPITATLVRPTGVYGALARIGIGDSSTAAAQSQTALQAASNKVLVTVTSATLTGGSPNKMQWVAAFAPGVGEWGTGWQEWVVDNGATAGETLNRFVQNLGTKAGGTWTLTVTIGIA